MGKGKLQEEEGSKEIWVWGVMLLFFMMRECLYGIGKQRGKFMI